MNPAFGIHLARLSPERTGDASAVLSRAGSGAPLILDHIFREYAPQVHHLARRILGNDTDAEDVTQNVFLQLVRQLPTFRGESAFSTWLYRVAVNTALAFRRQREAHAVHRAKDPLEHVLENGTHRPSPWLRVADPEKVVLDREAQRVIEGAIAQLPPNDRDVYVLADIDELPNAEIAHRIGLSPAAVKSRLHRARRRLRQALAPYFREMVRDDLDRAAVSPSAQQNGRDANGSIAAWPALRHLSPAHPGQGRISRLISP